MLVMKKALPENGKGFKRSPGRDASGRFLKKAAQKFFYAGPWALSETQPMAQHSKVFLLLFVNKK
jgi:hypothetical protein